MTTETPTGAAHELGARAAAYREHVETCRPCLDEQPCLYEDLLGAFVDAAAYRLGLESRR